MVLRRAFAILTLLAVACSVELAEPVRDDDTGGTGGKGKGGSTGFGGNGATGQGGAANGGSASGGTGLGQSGGGTGGSGDTCTDCVLAKCTAVDATCNASTECSALRSCLKACDNPNCQLGCYSQHAAYNDYYALESCVYQSCAVECQIWTPDCWSCDQTNCMGPLKNCMSDYDCLAFWKCIGTCPDAACYDYCVTQFPEGEPFDTAYQTCSFSMCKTPCYP
jgi:hypothetical protein